MTPKSKLKTAPLKTPVTLEEVKEFLRIDESADDDQLTGLIAVATKTVETYIDKKLITQVWSIFFDCFPRAARSDKWWDGVRDGAIGELFTPSKRIEIPFAPLASAVVRTHDESNAYTMDPSTYRVDDMSALGAIVLKTGCMWPTTTLRSVNGIEIEATLGYGLNEADVPEPIRRAILLMVSKLYDNRGDDTSSEFFGTSGFTLPNTAQLLLEPYRNIKVF